MEAAARLAELSVDDSLKIMALLAELAKRLLEENVAFEQACAAASDSREAIMLRADHIHETMRLMTDAASQAAAIGAEARLRFSRLLTEQLASGSTDLLDTFQSFFKVLPAHDAETVQAIEHALARGSSAFEQVAAVVAASSGENRGNSRRPRPGARYPRSTAPVMAPAAQPVEPRVC